MSLYLGLMSGTSIDAIDAVLLDLGSEQVRVVQQSSREFPAALKTALESALDTDHLSATDLWRLDALLGEEFATAALDCLGAAAIPASEVKAIGSHGQTIFHAPHAKPPVTVQLGDPNIIAQRCAITTVADFRRRDLAAGGEGAPLAPAFHHAVFSKPGCDRGILNLGGIANISLLPGDPARPLLGFDTGPANTLMDLWCQCHHGEAYDSQGNFAASGSLNQELLEKLLDDPYFRRLCPKSTGREYFDMDWLEKRLLPGLAPASVQRTLCELTVRSVAAGIAAQSVEISELYVCGGGARNPVLMEALARVMAPCTVAVTDVLGISAQAVEGAAFAWLAKQCLDGLPGNRPEVTGARDSVILGGIYPV